MKKVALVLLLAVVAPSLALAWLAVRSLRDQEYLLQRQQSLLYQGVADNVSTEAQSLLNSYEREFAGVVGLMLVGHNPQEVTASFDDQLRVRWPLAQVGFVVNLSGAILCPSPQARPDTKTFCANYDQFLSCRQSAEVYWTANAPGNDFADNGVQKFAQNNPSAQTSSSEFDYSLNRNFKSKPPMSRSVSPQQQTLPAIKGQQQGDSTQSFSKIAASEAEFCQLMGTATDGMLARFVDNKLNVLFWYRRPEYPLYVFGAQLSLPRLVEKLRPSLDKLDPSLREEVCIGLLDDTARPVALSHPGFRTAWKRPFVATEIGETLPHWEVGLYLLDPTKLTRSARTLKLTLGLVIGLLVLAIGIGSWLLVADLNRQLTLARQKTDFVSNVSHELKTPLTSIRMFSELLAEGRVVDPVKQRSYLSIITAETARLSRLINNVLDFARIERGEKKYHFQTCDLNNLLRDTTETYRPHLEANGFQFDCQLPDSPLTVNGDRDALAQVIVNLLSNAEKYSDSHKQISVRLEQQTAPLPHVEVIVLDRGLGVPDGSEEKIFEQFYRAHDSLSSGIQGSGLGLTLARQIARAHGGEVVYEPREGGGSCFTLRLPLCPACDKKSASLPL
jgi:signal transduction histidine kinase